MVWAVSLSTMKLIPHCLTPEVRYIGIGGLVGFGKLTPPSPSRALPPTFTLEAAPKCISGRTSYLRVRLAFHLYPQLIPYFCTSNGFGPPLRYYRSFTLAMGSSPGFGSNPRDLVPPPEGERTVRPIQTRFRCGSASEMLNQPRRLTRRLILQ